MSDATELSAEELRGRLYHSLREKGLVDALKSQLRNKLVSELKHMGVKETLPEPEPRYSKEGSLLHKAANSVVADHLRRCNYDYSLSVFLPETGNTQEKIFTTRDLLQLLNISPQSRLYQNLASQSAYPKKGFLWQILCELASLHGLSSHDAGAQTDPVSLPPITSLEEQFRELDTHYSSMGDFLKNKMFVEERILNYQHQLDERSRTDVQLEVARFKENELSRMRMEERESHRQELDKLRKEMERTYQSKLTALQDRERHATERLQQMQEIQEKETYNQRQQILEEIESIRGKEVQMRRQQEIDQREKVLWEEKFKSKDELVKSREEMVRNKDMELEQKLSESMRKYKLEEQSRNLEKSNELELREARVKDDERRLYDELHGLQAVKDELKEKRARVNELEGDLIHIRHEAIKSEKENELLSEKIRNMVDYPMLKDEHNINKKEVTALKERITELTRDNMIGRQKQEELLREMTDRSGKPTPELYFLQQQMEKLQNELRQERILGEHQRRQAEERLREEGDRNRDLLRKFEEQSLQKKEMGHEMHDLRDQLGDTRQALTNEVYRKPHSSVIASELKYFRTSLSLGQYHLNQSLNQSQPDSVSEPTYTSVEISSYRPAVKYNYGRSDSLCDLDTDVDLEAPGAVDPGLIHTHATPANLYSARSQAADHSDTVGDSDDYSYSFDLVRDTKHRLQNLEKEAQNLERHYQNFQQRMTSLPTPFDPPPPTHSGNVTPTPNRSRVTFQENQLVASPTFAGSRNAALTPSSTDMAADRRGTPGNASRPLSSTPSRPSAYTSSHDMMNTSVSTVRSSPERNVETVRPRPLSMDDLEARPGSPSVLVMPNSDGSAPSGSGHRPPAHRASPSGEEGALSEAAAPTISLDDAWKPSALPSLDNAWNSQQQRDNEDDRRRMQEEEERRRRQEEEEDRMYEEQRRKREEDRRRKEEEARERERQALMELEGKRPAPVMKEEVKEPKEEETKDEDGIDPVMKKYMEMVAQQKQKQQNNEKNGVAQKTVDTWKKGSKPRTPSGSEPDLSISDEDKSLDTFGKDNHGGKGSDEDFW